MTSPSNSHYKLITVFEECANSHACRFLGHDFVGFGLEKGTKFPILVEWNVKKKHIWHSFKSIYISRTWRLRKGRRGRWRGANPLFLFLPFQRLVRRLFLTRLLRQQNVSFATGCILTVVILFTIMTNNYRRSLKNCHPQPFVSVIFFAIKTL